MELYFRNSKGVKAESAELKKGTIHHALDHLFTFQTIRVEHVARELKTLLAKKQFMDSHPPKADTWVKSTLYRWKDQVTVVYTKCAFCSCVSKFLLQVDLIPNCTVQRTIGDYYVVLETVNKQGPHMLESVTRVHIVCLAGFEFEDLVTNVVPTCTCPANRNAKDCCAGIMKALESHAKFKDWYQNGNSWHKKELLHRRHRADCDPFIDIANVLHKPTEAKIIAYAPEASPKTSKKILSPETVDKMWKQLLAKAGTDQHFVSRPIHPFYLCTQNLTPLQVGQSGRNH